MAKESATIATAINQSIRTLEFVVKGAAADGGSKTLTLHLERVNAANIDYAAFHGFKQRISDAAAIPFDKETNRYATAAEKFDAMKELIEHYESNVAEWALRSGGGLREGSLLFQALTLMRGEQAAEDPSMARTAEQIRTFIEGLDKSQRAKLLLSSQVRPFADRVRAEAGKGVDAEEMLTGL